MYSPSIMSLECWMGERKSLVEFCGMDWKIIIRERRLDSGEKINNHESILLEKFATIKL